VQLRAASCVVHCEQALARIDDFLEPLVTDMHSRRESALVDDEFASEGEQLVAQSFRSAVLEALRQGASLEHAEHVERQRVDA
jgi:hypothetical protein